MKSEDLSLLLQLVSSMSSASRELEDAINKGDVEKFRKTKEEMINFQKQMAKLIG